MALRFARASRLPPILALQVSTCRIPQYACFFLHTLCKFYAIVGGCRSRAQAFDEGYVLGQQETCFQVPRRLDWHYQYERTATQSSRRLLEGGLAVCI